MGVLGVCGDVRGLLVREFVVVGVLCFWGRRVGWFVVYWLDSGWSCLSVCFVVIVWVAGFGFVLASWGDVWLWAFVVLCLGLLCGCCVDGWLFFLVAVFGLVIVWSCEQFVIAD